MEGVFFLSLVIIAFIGWLMIKLDRIENKITDIILELKEKQGKG